MSATSNSPLPPSTGQAADSKTDRRYVKRVLSLLVTFAAVGTLLWLLRRIGWANVGAAFLRLGIGGVVLLTVLGVFENAFDAYSLHIALRRRIPALRVLGYSGLGGLVNTLIPWDFGEIVKVGLLRRHVTLSDAVTGTVVWNYLCKLSRPIVGTVAAFVGLLGCPSIPSSVRWAVVGASVLSASPYFAIKWVLHQGALANVLALLTKLRLVSRTRSLDLRTHAVEFDAQFRDFYRNDPRAYWEMLAYQLLGKIASWAALYVTARLLGFDYSLALSGLLFAAISVATYVYMLVPSRLGVGEVAGAGVFVLLGLPFDVGLLIQLIMRIKGLLTMTIASIFGGSSVAFLPSEPEIDPSPPPSST